MNNAQIEKLVDTVLSEEDVLSPHWESVGNYRQRFMLGRVYPEKFAAAPQPDQKRSTMQTECLFCPKADHAEIEVTVRFFQPLLREVGTVAEPLHSWPPREEPAVDIVRVFELDGALYQSWAETTERKISASIQLNGIPSLVPFFFPASRSLEPIKDRVGRIVAVIIRRQPSVGGTIELHAEPARAGGAFRLTLRVVNRSRVSADERHDVEAILSRTFISTHAIFRAHAAEFISLSTPPELYAAASAACENVGVWPALVGEEPATDHDTVVAAPIFLPDYPPLLTHSAGHPLAALG